MNVERHRSTERAIVRQHLKEEKRRKRREKERREEKGGKINNKVTPPGSKTNLGINFLD